MSYRFGQYLIYFSYECFKAEVIELTTIKYYQSKDYSTIESYIKDFLDRRKESRIEQLLENAKKLEESAYNYICTFGMPDNNVLFSYGDDYLRFKEARIDSESYSIDVCFKYEIEE